MQPPSQTNSIDAGANSLVLIGSSARAAAFDAKIAGFDVFAVDRFGDEDLVANVQRWVPYDNNHSWLNELADWPDMPIVPVGGFSWGGLETNQTLSGLDFRNRLVAYPSQKTLDELNAPDRLAEVAKLCDVDFPETWELQDDEMTRIASSSIPLPSTEKKWLIKPRKHAGGIGIRRANEDHSMSHDERRQRMIPGRTIGANFISTGQPFPLKAVSLGIYGGITYRRHKAHPFLYGGSYGPLMLPEDVLRRINALGQVIAETFSLRGLFNVDLILTKDNKLWLLEVNPRYSASMELTSRAAAFLEPSGESSTLSLIDLHLGCYQNRATIANQIDTYHELLASCSSTTVLSKRVVYAKRDATYPVISIKSFPAEDQVWIADLPSSNVCTRDGEPICTVICRNSVSLCRSLRKSANIARLVRATRMDHR